ncbi:MAG: M3 family oligoendopeptidase, partial [Oscillospiraceae bacterium]|nr:M3 family oligoendopeptidase [Oscillospiraceae bacterium]
FGKAEIFDAAKEMYHAMGEETGAFIDEMLESEAFDVDSRKNKWGGGYCTDFPKWKQPFILANFNGTAGDVDVVTHEAGHALNAWLIADNRFALELGCGGMETAETHSMSMEFFAWPYMEKFFGDRAGDYCYMHALESFSFLPYGTMVDAFQHIVYENPEMTPAERNAAWLKLEKDFRPHISMEGIPYLEEGTRWQYQMHIYEMPFYYIDYCLAQTAAFCFLLASRENYEDAFARYLHLSRQGGEKLWTELLKEAGFRTPFEPGALKELAEKVEQMLNDIRGQTGRE